MEDAGQKLKQIRERLGLTYRDVEELSGKIAQSRRNDEFAVALSRLGRYRKPGSSAFLLSAV
jgi:transcriptional regulator with XRE-family HTH domain